MTRARNDAELADRCGVSTGKVSDWRRGRYGLTLRIARRVAERLGVPLADVLGEEPLGPAAQPGVLSDWIPGFAYAEAGEGFEIDDMGFPLGGADFIVARAPHNRDPGSFAVRAEGKSMWPDVRPGWAAQVVGADVRSPGVSDLVVAKIRDETGDGYRVVLKEYRGERRIGGKKILWLKSSNPAEPDIEVPVDRVLHLYTVVGLFPPSSQREPT